ncbi:hypothetical protein HK098_002131 [Nowakowskiella sp. JEL0407]|nr:hypothetical protein HK098_002131 [Nowakowskiella sp. JEL0407]
MGEATGEISIYYIIPFLGLVLSIAIIPLIKPLLHYWEKYYWIIAALWSVALLIPFSIQYSPGYMAYHLVYTVIDEYLPFVLMVGSLYVVAGGIVLEGKLPGTPLTNTLLLAVGIPLCLLLGTTGASMILIRPLLRSISHRVHDTHTVIFFIFLVSNVAGALTPNGNPPVFIGFLKGVDFFWPLANDSLVMLLTSAYLLAVYFLMDYYFFRKEQKLQGNSLLPRETSLNENIEIEKRAEDGTPKVDEISKEVNCNEKNCEDESLNKRLIRDTINRTTGEVWEVEDDATEDGNAKPSGAEESEKRKITSSMKAAKMKPSTSSPLLQNSPSLPLQNSPAIPLQNSPSPLSKFDKSQQNIPKFDPLPGNFSTVGLELTIESTMVETSNDPDLIKHITSDAEEIMHMEKQKSRWLLAERQSKNGFRLRGWRNVILILLIAVVIIVSGYIEKGFPDAGFQVMEDPLYHKEKLFVSYASLGRDLLLLAIPIISFVVTPARIYIENNFTWEPLNEVVILFINIFITLSPILIMFEEGTSGPLGFVIESVTKPWHFFWISGVMSAFLDNAPTYLLFFDSAGGDAQVLMSTKAQILAALTAGSCFFGGMTYIGNAPNMLIRNVAVQNGLNMPSFLMYIVWAVVILVPIFLIDTAIFYL